MTLATLRVLKALLDKPSSEQYGLQVMEATTLTSGALYPLLRRLESHGVVSSRWEAEALARSAGRPPRRYYALTKDGAALAKQELSALTPIVQPSNRVRPALRPRFA